ncbi:hypothetical protein LWI28_008469 [Acer negundo]|uniref:Uncharacterized protein n=1 Tax=Acer negundo TaxID=4023 RepID=A0AAD5J8H0_ACENE|nr:hypothetical protein LWI28_008469 [Acer negundo]
MIGVAKMEAIEELGLGGGGGEIRGHIGGVPRRREDEESTMFDPCNSRTFRDLSALQDVERLLPLGSRKRQRLLHQQQGEMKTVMIRRIPEQFHQPQAQLQSRDRHGLMLGCRSILNRLPHEPQL